MTCWITAAVHVTLASLHLWYLLSHDEGCPCTPELLFQGTWAGGDPVFPDARGIFNRTARPADFVRRPGNADSPYIGWWYMLHGGAGALISSGAMRRATLQAVQVFYAGMPVQSGDAMLSRAFWHILNLAPTDPGYGFCRPHIQMFNPGYKGERARGREDVGTADAGSDPLGVLDRLEAALVDSGCAADCQDQLSHTISVHVRSRYVAEELSAESHAQIAPEDGHPQYRVACHVITRLAILGEQY